MSTYWTFHRIAGILAAGFITAVMFHDGWPDDPRAMVLGTLCAVALVAFVVAPPSEI